MNCSLCEKTGLLLSKVLEGILQATSILIPHVVCILVAKTNLMSMRILLLASVVNGIQFIAH